MNVIKKINTTLRSNPVLYMTASAMIALTIQFVGLELHKRAQAARERKALEAKEKEQEALSLASASSNQSASPEQSFMQTVQLRPSR